jgi:hypothetical protein
MVTVPFALSIHKFINSIGADVGFASIIAVALLVLLYFAHAREAASLRDRLEEAHTRIAGLEARLMQLLNAQAASQRPRSPVPPPPGVTTAAVAAPGAAPPRPAGAAIPSVRRIPTATAAAALANPPANGGMPGLAPPGVGAPALASATKVIPTALPAPAAAVATQVPDATMVVAAAANGHEPAAVSGDTQALTAVAASVGGSTRQNPDPAPATPPPVRIGADGPADGPRRRTPVSSLLDEDFARERGGLRRSGRLLPLLISAAAVVVIVVALILITGSGSGSPTVGVVKHTATTPTGASVSNQKHKPAPFDAAKVKVAVLNGTAVAGLAADVAKVLTGDGYRQGNVTNAAVQTESSTVVYYVTGAHTAANKVAAQHIAASLSLLAGSVQPAPQSALQSCATGPTGNALGSCTADAIVSVGSDKASLASSNAG